MFVNGCVCNISDPYARSRRGERVARRAAGGSTRIFLAAFLAGLVGLHLGVLHPTRAQDSEVPQVTRTVAIENARIVEAPGRVLERGTVVFQRGVITAVGADVEVPYDARIIEGDSLTVYAGLVDGLSHVGLAEPENASPEAPVNRADPPDAVAGIQPQRSAVDMLDPTHESVAALREAGFTAAHVVPPGRMLPGRGALVLLTGESPAEMLLRPDASLFFQFSGAPAVYPATPMGVMAGLRQLFREAERRRRVEQMYAENPAGMERPPVDPVHQALYPALGGLLPVFVLADGDDSALEVHRGMALREELGFQLALAGLHQGFEVVPHLTGEGIPLFLTLDLPEPPDTTTADTTGTTEEAEPTEADTAHTMTPEDPASFFVSDHRTHSYEDVESERHNLEARQALVRRRYYGTAADFHEAGLRFGVSTLGVDADDIRKNVKRMIDAGLPEEAALAALTIDGARLLGIDRNVGTIEPGKLANLVVVKGSYFEPQDEIVFVIVDGNVYEVGDE